MHSGPSFGAILESAVAGEWLKAARHRGEPAFLFHWLSAGGLEVDLVLERNQILYGIEVKATSTPSPGHARALQAWMDLVGSRARGVIACLVDEPTPLGRWVRAVPWHLGWVGA